MDLFKVMQKRRAYRSLEPVEITEKIIHKLAESAQIAPSCFNNQPWRYIFVYDRASLNEIFTTLPDGNAWAKEASLVIAVFSRADYDCQIKERDYYLFDTGMATAFIILRAAEQGLVAHPIAGFREKEVKKILDIPDEMKVITLVIVGKHSATISSVLSEKQIESEKKRPERMPIEEFVYQNRYPAKRTIKSPNLSCSLSRSRCYI